MVYKLCNTMEIIEQIKQICLETNNTWFLEKSFTQIALYDLKLKEEYEKKNILNFDERECICNQRNKEGCIYCEIEIIRRDDLDELKLLKHCNSIYDYEKCEYTKSKWILAEKIDGIIPGFMLIKCCGDGFDSKVFTHGLVFAYVRNTYRKRGILKNMVSSLPKEWNIWLEASNNETKRIQTVWKKCGFSYYKTINRMHQIYSKFKTPSDPENRAKQYTSP